MKKRILFVMDSLGIGGSERSLVTLLSLLDYSKHSIDLQLFTRGGQFEQFLPKEVNVLPLLEYSEFLKKNRWQQFLSLDIPKICARWRFSTSLRLRHLSGLDIPSLFWKAASKCIPTAEETYDVAIAYSQGVSTMYVVDKVKAKRKAGWVNAMYDMKKKAKNYTCRFYKALDVVNAVSEDVKGVFAVTMPESRDKLVVVKDITSEDIVERMSQMSMDYILDKDVPIILTVSRLKNGQKGLDITLDTARILHERGVCFHWYVLGCGSYRNEIEKYIAQHQLQESLTLLGAVANPYPYMKAATLYVQTSRFEGYGLSIAEARLLNIPVVTTAYEGVYMQMIPDKNGVVVPIEATAVAAAVEDLLNNPEKREAISLYQRTEKKGNTEEIQKFYELILGEKPV